MAAADPYSYDSSRKRPLEDEQVANGRASKRSNAAGSKKPFLKILIPNHIAGKLIGKGGSNINELESTYNASIQVSPNKEFYPGTEERIVTISAEVEQIIEFCNNMIENVLVDKTPDRMYSGNVDFKIVITNVAVGLVMGKGGSVIKVIQDESHAKINIAKQDESSVHGERLLRISGGIEQQMTACSQIIERMSAEPMKMSNSNLKYGGYGVGNGAGAYNNQMNMAYSIPQQPAMYQSYPAVKPEMPRYAMDIATTANTYPANSYSYSYSPANTYPANSYSANSYPANSYSANSYSVNSYSASYSANSYPANSYTPSYYEQKSRVKTTHMIQMEIPNQMVGAIVGKQGFTINEFTRNSGAKINFSGKDEFAPGTTDRILTIKGNKSEVQTAFMLIDQKVAQVESEFEGGQSSFIRR